MNTTLRVGLLGAAVAAFMFQDRIRGWFSGSSAPAPSPGGDGDTKPPAQNPGNPAVPVTEALIKQATWDDDAAATLGTRVLYSVHEWNWFFEAAKGVNPGVDFSDQGVDPNVKITAQEYRAIRRKAGLSGLLRIGAYRR